VTFLGSTYSLSVLERPRLNAPFFKVGILPSDYDFLRFQRTVRIVATISTYGADRNVPVLYVLVKLRFQCTAQIVTDRNLEIFNGSDVLEFYKFRKALTCLKSHDVFLLDARKKNKLKRSKVTRPN
jgi:hypothetical protein